ncbi:MAG: 50S ribosomal protein L6 [Nitrospira sp.]|nr:50S ribosomal protein L6 [bacterium]MBL7049314.1 50S ribosomal protein L6 [Nitrospira sp.]
MSRVGKNPISMPVGVEAKIQNSEITVKGPKGELKWRHAYGVKVKVEDRSIVVERLSDSKLNRALHGTTRSIIANMVEGTGIGYKRDLEVNGVGYRAAVQGSKLALTLGYSHPIEYNLPDGVTAEVDKKQTLVSLISIDKQLIGQTAANIRALRKPNVYKGKGVRYAGEVIKLKVGKAGK